MEQSRGAAVKARRQAYALTVVAATVSTTLSAQGMVGVGTDLMGLAPGVALALAGFLELGLVSSALLSRAVALEGRPGGADALATWVLSAVSGTLSAGHELIGRPGVDGDRGWDLDAGSIIAAGARLVAPLVAAWLWERLLVAARRDATSSRSWTEVRRDRRLLALARAALLVRRLEEAELDEQSRALRRARRRLDRQHVRVMRLCPPSSGQATDWLRSIGAVDTFASATVPTVARAAEDAVPSPAPPAAAAPQVDSEPEESETYAQAVDVIDVNTTPLAAMDQLGAAVEIVRAYGQVTGDVMAQAMTSRGWPMTSRSGRTWVRKAVAAIEQADQHQQMSQVSAEDLVTL